MDDALDRRLELLEQQLENVQRSILDRLEEPRVGFSEEVSAKRAKRLPVNVKEISLEEIQSFYHDCFFPPIYEGPFPDDGSRLEDTDVTPILYEYRQDTSYAVIQQNKPMDKFIEHLAGFLGPQAAKTNLRCPLAFSYEGEYYQLLGYGVADKCVIGQIKGFFRYDPVAKFLRNKLKTAGEKSQDEVFEKKVLYIEKIRCPWAEVVAYALLLDMDLKEGRYVDRKRAKLNMSSFESLKRDAAAAFIQYYTGSV